MRRLLADRPALTRSRWEGTGNTPLHVAALNGWKEEVLLLLEADAAVCLVENSQGNRPSALALERGHKELAQYLQQKETQI